MEKSISLLKSCKSLS